MIGCALQGWLFGATSTTEEKPDTGPYAEYDKRVADRKRHMMEQSQRAADGHRYMTAFARTQGIYP